MRATRTFSPAAALLVASLPFLQPGVLAVSYGTVGIGLVLLAAYFAVLRDITSLSVARGSVMLWSFMAASVVWTLARTQVVRTNTNDVLLGSAQLLLILIAFAVVLSKRERAVQFARGFVYLVIALCASYVVTAGLWQVGGATAGKYANLAVGPIIGQLFFPFTPTIGHQGVFGLSFFRFTGLGREPGWMGIFIGVAWFLWPLVGKPRWWGRVFLLIGLLGTFSTASFGIFVVVLAYDMFLRSRPNLTPEAALLRRGLGLGVMGLAAWVAYSAPVFGLSVKGEQNADSLSQRADVTQRGIDALADLSLGEVATYANANLNLIASVATNGWPYLVLILLALLMPRVGNPGARFTSAPIAVIALTLLMAQPPAGSFSVFALAIAVYSLAYFTATPEQEDQPRGLRDKAELIPRRHSYVYPPARR